jgi:thiol-disulfide isomerase/thioredoxin
VVLSLAACGQKSAPTTAPPTPVAAQPAAPAFPSPGAAPPGPAAKPAAPPPLLGHITRADLTAYEPWQPLFAAPPYEPDSAAVKTIAAAGRNIEVLAIVATWCPDSKREMPRFFAILDAAKLSGTELTMIAVDRTKKDPEGVTEKWRVLRVPTIIFIKGGKEVGRFVERVPAGTTLEAEIAKALLGKAGT